MGADWFKGLSQGKSPDGGTKLYGASGRVKRTGVWELPIGTTAREILEQHAGGMQDGLALKAGCPAAPRPTSCCPSTSILRWISTPS
jgi:NADH-quinone oxidoreductase subunit F